MNEVEGHPSDEDDGDGDGVINDVVGATCEGYDKVFKDVPLRRKRKPYERILFQKLKKVVNDKDGGSSPANPISLE